MAYPSDAAGMRSRIERCRSGSSYNAWVLSVAIYPGAIALTFTPLDAHSLDSALVSPTMPLFAV